MPMTNRELIEQTRNNLIAQREKISRKPKPTYDIDGQKVSWESYFKMLTEQIDKLKEQLDDEDDAGIVEIHTTALP